MRHAENQLATIVLRLMLPAAMGVAFLAAVYIRFYSGWIPTEDLPRWPAYTAYFVASAAIWWGLEWRFGLVESCLAEASLSRWIASVAQLDLLTLALVSSATFFWRGYSFSRYTVAMFWGLHLALSLLAAWAVRSWAARRNGSTAICLFHTGSLPDLDLWRAEFLPAEARVVGYPSANAVAAAEALRSFQPPPWCREVIVVVEAAEAQHLGALAEALDALPAPSSISLRGLPGGGLMWSVDTRAAQAFDYVFSKRLVDLALSALGLAALGPLLAAIAVVIWWRSGRPVFLVQERVGGGGRRFGLYKFRTLPVTSLAASDHQWTPPPTDAWGRFLRSTGLDELPQLWNVLKGDMSLVGPRPERPHFVDEFRRQLPFYSTRHRLQAGITGWAQVHGWRGNTSIGRRVEHDLYYLRHWSLALDFRILWMTLADFIQRLRGAAHARGL